MALSNWLIALRKALGAGSPPRRRRARTEMPITQHVEYLESRVLLSVSSFVNESNYLYITSSGADTIVVTASGGNVKINGNDPDTGAFAASSLGSLRIQGGAGSQRD